MGRLDALTSTARVETRRFMHGDTHASCVTTSGQGLRTLPSSLTKQPLTSSRDKVNYHVGVDARLLSPIGLTLGRPSEGPSLLPSHKYLEVFAALLGPSTMAYPLLR